MSHNLVSQQLSLSTQSELGTGPEAIDPSVHMAMTGSLLHHLPVAKMQMGPTASCISVSMSDMVYSPNMDVRSSNLISSYQEAHSQAVLVEQQKGNVMAQASFVLHNPAAGAGSMSAKMIAAQLPIKRKSPMELMSNHSAVQLPNKRLAPMEHRPWLQGTSELNQRHMQTSSISPRAHYLPVLNKRTVQLGPVSGNKSVKQIALTKQNLQKQLPSKPQNDLSESLRCKMRVSLAGALALVQSEVPTLSKSLNQTAKALCKSDVGSQNSDSASAASEADVMFSNVRKRSGAEESNAQGSQFLNLFPQDNVSYSDNVFSKDDLLQGNGLSWALDSNVEFIGNTQSELVETGNQGRIKEKSILDPKILAFRIEAELFKLFDGVNKKYKEKGRSLLFNLKDKSNPELREKVMYGEIPAERLCSMSAEELASKELAEWRQAKAEEMAQMVVLPDTEVDISRLVRKTHKGEFQVEVEPIDSSSVEVAVGSSSLNWSRSKKSPLISRKRNTSAPAIPSNASRSPRKGITVDDEMKDATGSLPPIVSLDEFMVSPDSNSPGSLSTDAGKETPISDKTDADTSSILVSPKQSPDVHGDASPVKTKNDETESSKPSADVTTSTLIPEGERVWEGAFQLSVSSSTSVVGIFRSGEKTSAREWPMLLEIKGRVKLDAFEKFLREISNSRSRAVMVMCFVCKEECPKTQRDNLFEVAESYVKDERVGIAEPAAGVELYICPTQGRATKIVSKIMTRKQLDFMKSLNHALIGIVVWRRKSLLKPSSSNSHKTHFQNITPNVNIFPDNSHHSHHHHNHDDGDDDDLPPGFGPEVAVAAQDDDDLPEFNFGCGGHTQMGPAAQMKQSGSQSLQQVRELILKYGDEGESDIPEWQPLMTPNPNQALHLSRNHGFYGVSVARPDGGGWWSHQQHPNRRRNDGF